MVLPDGMDMTTAAPLFCAGITGECGVKQYVYLIGRGKVLTHSTKPIML